MGICRQSEKL
jgi:hypothetical protein